MLYLGNNHIGFDTQALGFPSVKGCQAIVYQTQQGLFGFHDMRTGSTPVLTYNQVLTLKIAEFAQWVQNHSINHAAQALQIYGVINQGEQYTKDKAGKTEWGNMLADVATALNFNGSVYGVRLDNHIAKDDSVYIRFDVDGTKCKIRYKTWSKMDYDRANQLALQPNEQQVLAKATPSTFDTRNPVEDLFPVKHKGTAPNTVAVDEGKLHTVSSFSIMRL